MTAGSDSHRPWLLVTGAAGFVASACRRLLAPEYRLVSIDCRPVSPVPLSDELTYRFDFGDVLALENFWDQTPPASLLAGVIHCAAYYDFANEPDERYDRLERGLEKLLELFARDAPRTAKFVQASSMATLQSCRPGERLTEFSPTSGAWEYPKSKLRLDAILDHAQSREAVVQLVLAGVYSDSVELVPLYQIIEALRTGPLERTFYPASPDRGLTYVHVDDAARAFQLALKLAPGPHRFLVGEDEPTPFGVIRKATLQVFLGSERWRLIRVPKIIAWLGAWFLAKISRLRGKPRFLQPWMIRFAGEHFAFDLTHTKAVLNWQSQRKLSASLIEMLQKARKNLPLWQQINEQRPWIKGKCGGS